MDGQMTWPWAAIISRKLTIFSPENAISTIRRFAGKQYLYLHTERIFHDDRNR
jgi:hypothetical protein